MKTPFKSYAQNFEDVMLYRALGDACPGFYIDVGAQDPDIDSVSKAFFERGWRGIHIEPVPEYAERLRQARPGDRVIEAAASNMVGTTALTVFPKTGLSTAEALVAKSHIDRGVDHQPEPITVPTVTLAELSLELATATVHWLKIDVEGHERSVLEGWDPKLLRPWIIVVEATLPNEQVTNYEEWEPILSKAGYQYVYDDGLNRFYIEPQREDLAQALSCPPNPFDNIHLGKHSALCNGVLAEAAQDLTGVKQKLTQSEQKLTESEQKRLKSEQKLTESEQKLTESEQKRLESEAGREVLKRQADALTDELQVMGRDLNLARAAGNALQHESESWRAAYDGVIQSWTWRLTAPVRRVLDLFVRPLRGQQAPSPVAPDLELEAPLTEMELSPEGNQWARRLRRAAKGDDS
ncbi:FkbM family methyltransferase [Luminiphilus sp.]|nr:FkbM family methyltransferase [Luminiphilus sp.]